MAWQVFKVVPMVVLLGELDLIQSPGHWGVTKSSSPFALCSLACHVSGFILPSAATMVWCLAQSNSDLVMGNRQHCEPKPNIFSFIS